MSMTPVPISIRLVLTPIAASSGKGEESWGAKWWTRTNAPSIPISSAAIASSTVWRSASPPVWVSPPPGCQAPNERKPILFGLVIVRLFQPGTRFVEIEKCAVQAELVEVAAGHLDPSGVGDTARFQRLEASGMDQPFDRRRSRAVVGGVEEHGLPRLAICRAREGVRGERAECLYVVRACGEQSGDHRAGRLSFGKRADHLPALVE